VLSEPERSLRPAKAFSFSRRTRCERGRAEWRREATDWLLYRERSGGGERRGVVLLDRLEPASHVPKVRDNTTRLGGRVRHVKRVVVYGDGLAADQLETLMVAAFTLLGKPEAQAQELARAILKAAEQPQSGDPRPPDPDPT
jgi:hypothetical protein